MCGYPLTSIAGNLRCGVRQGCQQRGLSCIREPGGDLTEENQMFPFANLNLSKIQLVCFFPFYSHPTRPMSAISLRSSLMCLASPLLGWNAEYSEPPDPPFATITRSPSTFKSPCKKNGRGNKLHCKNQVATALAVLLLLEKTRFTWLTVKDLTYRVFCPHQWWRWYQQEQGSPCLPPFLLSELERCW